VWWQPGWRAAAHRRGDRLLTGWRGPGLEFEDLSFAEARALARPAMTVVRGQLRARLAGRVQRASWRWLHPPAATGPATPSCSTTAWWTRVSRGGHLLAKVSERAVQPGVQARSWCLFRRAQVSGAVSTVRTLPDDRCPQYPHGCPPGRATRSPAIRIRPGCSACGSAAACPRPHVCAALSSRVSNLGRGVHRTLAGCLQRCPLCQRRDRTSDRSATAPSGLPVHHPHEPVRGRPISDRRPTASPPIRHRPPGVWNKLA
jgi:hypothetical protein